MAEGDARRALNLLERVLSLEPQSLTSEEHLTRVLQSIESYKPIVGLSEQAHYDFISVYIKAIRRSDENAALNALAELLRRGEDPVFVARRLVIFAAEDVGVASPHLLTYVQSIFMAVERIGMPEARILLSAGTLAASRARK